MDTTIIRKRRRAQDLIRSAIKRSPGLNVAVGSRPARWSIQTMRGASAVRPSCGFVKNQMRSSQIGWYRLRNSGLRVAIRHRSRDVAILNEIFGGTGGVNGYAPPPEVAASLDGVETPRIVDLGANIGLFGLYVLGRWPRARITAFEPDPANATLLEQTIAANEFQRQWRVRRSACSNRSGTVSFAAGLLSEARIADPGEPGTVEVETVDLFAEDHDADLLKIDIEGGEWAILTDDRLPELKAKSVVLEWHARRCPGWDPHAVASDLLRRAGYTEVLDVGDVQMGDTDGVLWAWRPARTY